MNIIPKLCCNTFPKLLYRAEEKLEYATDFVEGQLRFKNIIENRNADINRQDKDEGKYFQDGTNYSMIHPRFILSLFGPSTDFHHMHKFGVIVKIEHISEFTDKLLHYFATPIHIQYEHNPHKRKGNLTINKKKISNIYSSKLEALDCKLRILAVELLQISYKDSDEHDNIIVNTEKTYSAKKQQYINDNEWRFIIHPHIPKATYLKGGANDLYKILPYIKYIPVTLTLDKKQKIINLATTP